MCGFPFHLLGVTSTIREFTANHIGIDRNSAQIRRELEGRKLLRPRTSSRAWIPRSQQNGSAFPPFWSPRSVQVVSSSAVAPPGAALGLSWFQVRNQIDVQPAAGPCTKHVDGQQWRASTRPRGALAGVKNRLCLSASESRAHQTLSRVRIKVFMLDIHRRSPLRRQRRGCASTSRTFQDTTSSPDAVPLS